MKESLVSVVTDAVQTWKGRLAEIEEQIGPLLSEADELRDAIAKVESGTNGARRGATAARGERAAQGSRGRTRRTPSGRAPRGQNRQRILASIQDEAKTAGVISGETGISRNTVATTLTKLVSEGAARKAARGYQAA
jgi:predicted Rossmann fold nucleotide-binding protein DprA/Smf involved in DNA uptake